jgi:hypothetical protein
MLAVVIVEGVAILLLGLLVLGLLRSHAEILRSLHELGAGADLGATPRRPVTVEIGTRTGADVSGVMPDGTVAAIGVVGSEQNTLLAFLSTTCTTCMPFWDTLAGRHEVPADTRVVIVVQDEDSDKRLARLPTTDVPVVKSTAAWEAYEIPGSPHFVLVEGPTGRVLGEGTGNTWAQVLDLLGHATQMSPTTREYDHDHPDNPARIDAELAAAGIEPGHPSLYRSLEPPQS